MSVHPLDPVFHPRAVAVDSRDNVYILERGGHALRKVTPQGKIYTVAGTGEKGDATGHVLGKPGPVDLEIFREAVRRTVEYQLDFISEKGIHITDP